MKATVIVVLVASSNASAEPLDAISPTATPHFVVADGQDAEMHAGLQTQYFVVDGQGDGQLWRMDAHLNLVNPGSRIGAYAHLPLTFTEETSEDEAAVGNLEVGGIYVPELANASFGLSLHAGITAPTAPEDTSAMLGFLAGGMRPGDRYVTLPKSSTLRFGVSPLLHSGDVFARFDVGLDINLYVAGSDEPVDPAMHVNAGLGLDLGTMNAALMAEVSTLHVFGDARDMNTSVAALSVRGHSGQVEPYLGVALPLDKQLRETFDAGIVFGLDVTR